MRHKIERIKYRKQNKTLLDGDDQRKSFVIKKH